MDNLLESNERTLVIFDSVCSGLAECLSIVHADIKQMTEHRNQLALLEQERLQSKLVDPGTLERCATATSRRNGQPVDDKQQQQQQQQMMQTDLDATTDAQADLLGHHHHQARADSKQAEAEAARDQDDPHHLARLKLLDKRLADSFSQALSMCDQQKTSLNNKRQHYQATSGAGAGQQRPSFFQVLLGRGKTGDTNTAKQSARRHSKSSGKNIQEADEAASRRRRHNEPPDNRIVIDDINKQTRLAMQYSKQLEAHLFRVEDLRARYEMHLKMGLVVKSVSRAYSSSSAGASSSPNSLSRRAAHAGPSHYTSSLMVNDSSSLGTTAHSSLSSLNLSSWSFTRHRNKSSATTTTTTTSDRSRKNSTNGHHQCHCMATLAPGLDCMLDGDLDNSLSRQQQRRSANGDQKYVSTISLDSSSKGQKRSSLAKLISVSSSTTTTRQPCLHDSNQHYNHQNYEHDSPPPPPPPCCLPPGVGNHNAATSQQTCQCQQAMCRQDHEQAVIYNGGGGGGAARCQATPSPRPLSQHYAIGGDLVAPTSAGARPGEIVYINNQHSTRGGGGLLHKSASHSSLKSSKNSRLKGFGGNNQPTALASAGKTTIKEFMENIERIESELESYMGSFLLNIEDIQGFARVCQGDVFEINIKYGQAQKFKSKISVLKDSRQKCDNRQTVFKARIADVIAIKAYECKGLGKRVLLGHKLCETRDLFTARSQLMTISLNQTGSIKLNLIITWNPLHMAPQSTSLALPPGLDMAHISLPPTPVSSSTLSSLSSGQSSNNGQQQLTTLATLNNNNNNNSTTTLINIQSSNQRTTRSAQPQKLHSPNGVKPPSVSGQPVDVIAQHRHQHQHQHHHPQQLQLQMQQLQDGHDHPHRQHHGGHRAGAHAAAAAAAVSPGIGGQTRVYQDAEPAYGYYIPEPDYLTGDCRN